MSSAPSRGKVSSTRSSPLLRPSARARPSAGSRAPTGWRRCRGLRHVADAQPRSRGRAARHVAPPRAPPARGFTSPSTLRERGLAHARAQQAQCARRADAGPRPQDVALAIEAVQVRDFEHGGLPGRPMLGRSGAASLTPSRNHPRGIPVRRKRRRRRRRHRWRSSSRAAAARARRPRQPAGARLLRPGPAGAGLRHLWRRPPRHAGQLLHPRGRPPIRLRCDIEQARRHPVLRRQPAGAAAARACGCAHAGAGELRARGGRIAGRSTRLRLVAVDALRSRGRRDWAASSTRHWWARLRERSAARRCRCCATCCWNIAAQMAQQNAQACAPRLRSGRPGLQEVSP